ncbi:MAG: hypothetical protein L0Y71_25770, partial [Gemmataceae bacterium]|nr:hypothetical protein [Gemmataceae bacterium]
LDENGKATFTQPISGRVNKDIPEALKILPLQYGVTLNRAGRFTVQLRASCELCGKSTTVSLPVRILPME